jgi:hypothetical protein
MALGRQCGGSRVYSDYQQRQMSLLARSHRQCRAVALIVVENEA